MFCNTLAGSPSRLVVKTYVAGRPDLVGKVSEDSLEDIPSGRFVADRPCLAVAQHIDLGLGRLQLPAHNQLEAIADEHCLGS